jgi:alkylhydroperoxidase/carboxymuconolactone decarboxylase family protein YurZ
MTQPAGYMQRLQANDAEFAGVLAPVFAAAMAEGALTAKNKTLMILLLDSVKGSQDAVKALAARARTQGATEGEINETVRLAFIAAGISGLSAASAAFPDTE